MSEFFPFNGIVSAKNPDTEAKVQCDAVYDPDSGRWYLGVANVVTPPGIQLLGTWTDVQIASEATVTVVDNLDVPRCKAFRWMAIPTDASGNVSTFTFDFMLDERTNIVGLINNSEWIIKYTTVSVTTDPRLSSLNDIPHAGETIRIKIKNNAAATRYFNVYLYGVMS